MEEEPGKTDTASASAADKEKVVDGKTAEKSEDDSLTGQNEFSSRVAYIPSTEDVMVRRFIREVFWPMCGLPQLVWRYH